MSGISLCSVPELLAPAGDWDCAKAAVENGADSIYFGLRSGLNARARAVNFTPEELPELMTFLRRRGVKGYLTLNTLVFPEEWEAAETSIRLAAESGVDALIVQDLGLLRLAHRFCPELPLHASTQMTLSSVECIARTAALGVSRVVLPRELSLDEIAQIHRQTDIELEVFVHGSLCIGYSGQCLASLALGGRSGNRGQCAQACRLKYELLVSDRHDSTGNSDFIDEKKYLLSPCDLAAFDLLPRLIASGVSALKIEGRLKEAEYVAVVTGFYRRAIDEAAAGRSANFSPVEIAELEAAFSRGFSHGWLEGPNHQTLVLGDRSAKRGVLLGEVRGVQGDRVRIAPVSEVRRGMGVVFDGDRDADEEQGGRIYETFPVGNIANTSKSDPTDAEVELAFRHGLLDFEKIAVGQKVWLTDDPRLAKKWRQLAQNEIPQRRVPLSLAIEAAPGEKLRIAGRTTTGATCRLESPEPLADAQKHPLTEATLREQFGRLGGTIYELDRLEAKIIGRPMIPFSELGKLRRAMIDQLDESLAKPTSREINSEENVSNIRKTMQTLVGSMKETGGSVESNFSPGTSLRNRDEFALHVLCRSLEQLEIVIKNDATSVIVDFRDEKDCAAAIRMARQANCPILLSVPRIHRPGGNDFFARLEKLKPDGILARNLAAIAYFQAIKIPVVADFSLNAANELSMLELICQGASRVTTAYDLRRLSLARLLENVPPDSIEVILHGHVPMFHTAHCLFCGELSTGHDASNCGQPCRKHRVRLRDRLGVEHILTADADCRNTLFHGTAQSMAETVFEMKKIGIRHFRIELLDEDAARTARLLEIYRDLLSEKITGREAWSRLKTVEPAGVLRPLTAP
jgi:putative protease